MKMSKLRILVPIHTMPDITSVTTSFLENLLPTLRKKIDVHMIWFVYQPDKISIVSGIGSDQTILDIHDFKNAVYVLQTQKPDLIFANANYCFIDYAFSLAGKFLQIPVISPFYTDLAIPRDRLTQISSYANRFFASSVPTDKNKESNQKMRRGRFFIYKYGFLLRTQRSIKWNYIKIVQNFLLIISKIFESEHDSIPDARFSNTLHLVEGYGMVKSLTKAGFESSSIMPTGNPVFDSVYEKIKSMGITEEKSSKIRILMVTTSLYEHGFWTKDQRDKIIHDIVSQITKFKNEMSLTIKIHPSSESLFEYQTLVKDIDSYIPIYQTGDIFDFISKSDVIVSFQSSSALIYSLLLKKPVISCDFFNLGNDLLVKKGFATNCTNSSELINLVRKVTSNDYVQMEKTDEFISEFLCAFDGKCAERVSDAILKLLDHSKSSREI